VDDKIVKIVGLLVRAFPMFAEWIAGLIAGKDEHPDITRRVSDILDEQSASAAVAAKLRSEGQ